MSLNQSAGTAEIHIDTSETIATPDETEKLRILKRNGILQEVDYNKLLDCVRARCTDLKYVDAEYVVNKTINGIHDQIESKKIYEMLMQTTAMLISEEPEYSKLGARLLNRYIKDDVERFDIKSFSDSITYGFEAGLIHCGTRNFIICHAEKLNAAIKDRDLFEYFGLKTVHDRYLLKDPISKIPFETPQYFFMRVACGLGKTVDECIEFYNLISSFEYMPSTPTLFNSATQRAQMSSCYLLDSPQDDLKSIYQKYMDVAMLSKYAGGIGLSYSRVRASGSLIKGTNGSSKGIVPFLKTLDSSVSAVNQGGKRKGAACVYLESWHADIEDFLMLRENTGDEGLRTYNLNLANWVSDLFMRRVKNDQMWSLFCPSTVPELVDTYGEVFEKLYTEAEEKKIYKRQIKARDLYGQMMRSLAQTGNGWMTWKDASNLKANQVGKNPDNVIHLSNLCTEIIEVTSDKETAVCNLGSINLAKYVKDGDIDYEKLATNVQIATKYLDRVIDINYYPIDQALDSNRRWRPVGMGLMGLQDAFFQLGIPFDSPRALEISTRVQEEIYYNALMASCKLAAEYGPHPSYHETKASEGQLQFDLWGIKPTKPEWDILKSNMAKFGLRNSLLIAIAPTATIASIVGSYECIEPQVSNLFKRETLSGEFLQINTYLVDKLKELGLWNDFIKRKIKLAEGSIQNIDEIPEDTKKLFRTVWELKMKSLIDMAAARGAYIDQSQSLNLFMESPNIGKLSKMYMYAWEKGLKTTYYLRSRAATRIKKTTVSSSEAEAEAVACSLENPEACESCQ